jgi:hypothetical protein
MLSLFDAYDSTLNLNISFGLKFGILLNGALDATTSASLLTKLQSHLADMFKDMTGLEEVDGHHTNDGDEPEGKLHGAFEIVAHIADGFVRRFEGDGKIKETIYKVIN